MILALAELRDGELAELVAGSICWVSMLTLLTWPLGRLLFSPLYEPSVLFRVRASFRLSDLVVLAIQFQIALAAVLATTSRSATITTLTWMIATAVVLTFWWCNGLFMLSQSGVESTRDRWLFLGLLLPAGYLSILMIMATVFVFPLTVFTCLIAIEQRDGWLIFAAYLCMLAISVSIALTPILRWTSHRMAVRAREDRAVRDGIEWKSTRGIEPEAVDLRVRVD